MSKAAPKHRAKQEIKRTLKPGALDVPFRGTARFEFITMLCRRAVWRILRRYPEDVIG